MAAFRDHHLFHPQALGGVVQARGHRRPQFVVAVEQAEIGHVPAFAGHGPVLAREVEDGGGFGDGAGIVLGFARVDGVEHVRALLIDGNADARVAELGLQLLLHPVERFQIVFRQHAHLVAQFPLVLSHHRHAFRHDADMHQQAARHTVEGGHVHPHGAVDGAPPAVGALAEHGVLEILQFLIGVHAFGAHPPGEDLAGPVDVGLEELAQAVPLVRGRVGGIPRVGQHVMALVRAHAAVDAGLQRQQHLAVDLLVQPPPPPSALCRIVRVPCSRPLHQRINPAMSQRPAQVPARERIVNVMRDLAERHVNQEERRQERSTPAESLRRRRGRWAPPAGSAPARR